MIEYLNAHQYSFWITVGFVLLIVEVVALGFSSGVLLFSAIGALITGGLMSLGWLPETWLAGVACFGVSSALSAILLWKPLLRLQNYEVEEKDNSSDLIGYRFTLEQPVTRLSHGATRYSGIEWRVELEQEPAQAAGQEPRVDKLEAGTQVRVVSVDAGIFRVLPTV